MMLDERRPSHRACLWLLDRVPTPLRRTWPLRRFYWQQEDVDRGRAEAEQIRKDLGIE